jgi:hypothetical protein
MAPLLGWTAAAIEEEIDRAAGRFQLAGSDQTRDGAAP